MNKYTVEFSPDFNKSYEKLTRNNKSLKKSIRRAVNILSNDPFYPGLKTHKAGTRLYGEKYSSRVTGDIRIIWDFIDGKIILLITLGGHDAGGVYK